MSHTLKDMKDAGRDVANVEGAMKGEENAARERALLDREQAATAEFPAEPAPMIDKKKLKAKDEDKPKDDEGK
jgi:hypothetical protein